MSATKPTSQNEGEGSRTAAREYNEKTRQFIESGQVEAKAKEAERALDGPEKAELERAEQEGRRHSHGEDPQISRK